jgi:putative cell wall-binding protein
VGLKRLLGAATAALTATGFVTVFAGVTPAGAALAGTIITQPPGASPAILVTGKTGQTGASLLVRVPPTWAANDQVRVVFKNAAFCSGAGTNPGDTTTNGYNLSGTPTLTVVPETSGAAAATVSAPVLTSSKSDPQYNTPADTCSGPNQGLDQLTFTFQNSAGTNPSFQDVIISGLTWDIGSTASPGPLNSTVTTLDAGVAPPYAVGNTQLEANITAIVAVGNTPAVALPPATAGQAISPVLVAELQVNQIPSSAFVCIQMVAPGGPGNGTSGPNFTASAVPTVAATGGAPNPTATLHFPPGDAQHPTGIVFQTAAHSTTTPFTYTISGIKVDTGSASGLIAAIAGFSTVSAGAACGAGNILPVLLATIVGLKNLSGATRVDTAAAVFDFQYGSSGVDEECPSQAVLARGDAFPDSLSASYLAKFFDTGILLTSDPTTLPFTTLNELKLAGTTDVFVVGGPSAVSPAVITQLTNTPAYTCGGSNVRQGTGGQTIMLKVTVIGGATRYDTNQLVAQFPQAGFVDTFTMPATGVYTPGKVAGTSVPSPAPTAVIASGANFPDAVSGGAVAHGGFEGLPTFGSSHRQPDGQGCCQGYDSSDTTGGFPLIITDPNTLSPQASAALLNLGIKNALIVGGPAAESDPVVKAIQNTGTGIQTLQFAGADRTDTAQQLATFAQTTYADPPPPNVDCGPGFCTKIGGLGYASSGVTLARGDAFPDALTGSVLGNIVFTQPDNILHELQSPIILASNPTTLGTATTTFLTAHNVKNFGGYQDGPIDPDRNPASFGGITFMFTLGGTAALSPAVITAAQTALSS